MTTQKGRVVYDRKRNLLRPRDLARMLDSYTFNVNGREFAAFISSVLKLTLDRQARPTGWKLGFWLMLVNLAGGVPEAVLVDEDEATQREFFMGLGQEHAEVGVKEFERQEKGRFEKS